jgi:phage shock protein A
MKERLISRIGRIISGSFNSIVDAIENAVPETVMEEAIGHQ